MNPEDLMRLLMGDSRGSSTKQPVFGTPNISVDDDDIEFIKMLGEMGKLQCANTYQTVGGFGEAMRTNEVTNGETLFYFKFNIIAAVRIPHNVAKKFEGGGGLLALTKAVLAAGKEYDKVLKAIMEKHKQGEAND